MQLESFLPPLLIHKLAIFQHIFNSAFVIFWAIRTPYLTTLKNGLYPSVEITLTYFQVHSHLKLIGQ
jgi:hypothetical protein